MKKCKKIFILTLISGLIFMPTKIQALSKSETIYSTLQYDGTFQKTSVTNHLSFLDEKEAVDDTTLKNILNINGDEKFRMDGEKIIWENKGYDIFYRGMSENMLPIDVSVRYYLNEKEMKPQKMIGKKGKVKIVYHFTNKDKKTVRIQNQDTTLYTPFVVSIGTILEGKDNKDFSITTGKIISTGERNIVLGLSSPGMYDSVQLPELKALDEIIVTYSTTNFSLSNTYIVATPKFLDQEELVGFEKINTLYESMNQLEDNMQKLVSGADEISTGTTVAFDGTKLLSSNMKSLKQASLELKNGSINLNDGLHKLKEALVQIKNSISLQLQGKTIEEVLSQMQYLKSQNTMMIQNTLQKTGKTFEELQQIYVSNNLSNYVPQGASDPLGDIKNAYELILLFTSNNSAIDVNITILSSFKQFDVLLSSVEQLENGSSTLKNGLLSLDNGASMLQQGTEELEYGMKSLMDGGNSLKSGTKTFQEQGIHQLTSYTNKFKSYQNKIDALVELSKEYKGFASNNSDTTLFVYTIPSLKK